MEHPSHGDGVDGIVVRNADGSVTVTGRVSALGIQPQTIKWFAAAPATRGIGFAGSGMPYPNREIALADTPHHGELTSADGSFKLRLRGIPAGYFSGLGSVYVPPVIEFLAAGKDGKKAHVSLWINDTAVPYRWISGAPATLRPAVPESGAMGRAMFYSGREALPLFNNQEAALRARAYPSETTARGWPTSDDAAPWTNVVAPA